MNLLLDTHIFMWWDGASDKLSPELQATCRDRANTLWLSVASVWEMQVKLQLGKLQLRQALATIISEQQQINNVQLLSVELRHVLALAQLPAHHKDPFDRLLIAQALTDDLLLVTVDPVIQSYPVTTLS